MSFIFLIFFFNFQEKFFHSSQVSVMFCIFFDKRRRFLVFLDLEVGLNGDCDYGDCSRGSCPSLLHTESET